MVITLLRNVVNVLPKAANRQTMMAPKVHPRHLRLHLVLADKPARQVLERRGIDVVDL